MTDARTTMHPDLLGVDGLLTEEEREVREHVRAFSDTEVIPIMAECWEKGEFPSISSPSSLSSASAGTRSRGTDARASARSGQGSRRWSSPEATGASTRSSGRLLASP